MKIIHKVHSCRMRVLATGVLGALALGFVFTAPGQAYDVLPTATLAPSPAPVAAPQDCETQEGEPRECTATETYRQCVENVRDAQEQCLEDTVYYLDWLCNVAASVDLAACSSALIKEILF